MNRKGAQKKYVRSAAKEALKKNNAPKQNGAQGKWGKTSEQTGISNSGVTEQNFSGAIKGEADPPKGANGRTKGRKKVEERPRKERFCGGESLSPA